MNVHGTGDEVNLNKWKQLGLEQDGEGTQLLTSGRANKV